MFKSIRVFALSGVLWFFGIAGHAQSGQTAAGEPQTPIVSNGVSTGASAARLVKFSGTLRDGSGAPLTGTIGVTVSIYKDQQGGTALWMETQNVSLDAQGNYTVLLGATQSEGLPLELFSTGESRWLGVQAQLPGELEQPRVLLVSVPYALKAADAETLGGQPASAFLLNPEAITDQMLKTSASNGGTKAAVGTGPMAAISGSGTTNEVPKWTDGPNGILGDSSISESGGNVGVGTPATGERLTVNGPSNLAGDIDMTRRFDNFSQAFFAIDNVITTSMNFAKLGGGNVSNIGFFGNSIYAAGNLGVGTPATGERLTVNGPSNLAGDIDMTRRFDNFSQAFFSIDNVITTSMNFGKLGGGNVDNIGFFGNLIYIPGNVGIGTPSPSQMLDVNGNAHIGGNLSLTGTFNASAGTTFSGASASTFTAAPSGSGVNQGSLYVDPASAGAGQTLIGAAVNGTQEFKVDSGGNVNAAGVQTASAFSAATSAGIPVPNFSSITTTISGNNTAATGLTNGVAGQTSSTTNQSAGLAGVANAATGVTNGVFGATFSATNGAAGGNFGDLATTGVNYGVTASASSATTGAAGVQGNAGANGGQVYGVVGNTSSTTNFSAGVQGNAPVSTGMVFGVQGGTISTTNGAAGVEGGANATTGQTIGVFGYNNSTTNFAAGVVGGAFGTTGVIYGVVGNTSSTTNGSAGVQGNAPVSTGIVYGVNGGTLSTTNGAAGVQGGANATTGQTNGVRGYTNSTTNFSAGVEGNANASTGATFGVQGITSSTSVSPPGSGIPVGVQGIANAATTQVPTFGVQGITNSTGLSTPGSGFPVGVQGIANAATTDGPTFGVQGITNSTGVSTEGLGIPVGVQGAANAVTTVGPTLGVQGITNSTTDGSAGVQGSANSSTGQTFGVQGYNNSTADYSAGVRGNANATTGIVWGVAGFTNSTTNFSGGISGGANATTGQVYGVNAYTNSSTNSAAGVFGSANATTGVIYGVVGQTSSASGAGGLFNNTASGNILIGQAAGVNKFRVDGTGQGFFDGGTQTSGADFAEAVSPLGRKDRYEPGDVLMISMEKARTVERAGEAYSTRVAGIYSTKPGVLATPYGMDDPTTQKNIPLAVIGIVPCKVSTANGPIRRGDLLVASSTPGYAMKGTDRSRMLGAVVGKALESLVEGTGVIEVLVTLQ